MNVSLFIYSKIKKNNNYKIVFNKSYINRFFETRIYIEYILFSTNKNCYNVACDLSMN